MSAAASATSSLTPDPTTPAYSSDLDWITAYLTIHVLSDASCVYAYIFWIAVGAALVVCSALHLAGLRGGVLGAYWIKWAVRRRTWRKKHSLALAKRNGKPWRPPLPFPSNAQILTLAILVIAALLVSFLGPDYFAPGSTLWTVSNTPHASLTTRDVLPDQLSPPQYTIPKAWWTSGNRTGLIAFTLFPLCVLFALKAPPFAILALPCFVQLHFDKLAWLHRWSGRLIWFLTTLHVAFWSVQLVQDRRVGTGKMAYTYAWDFQRFIFAWIAYGAMTLLVLLSIRPVRTYFYELFYFLHILLVPLTIIMSALHHPQVWWWCGAALALWGGERLWRGTWWFYINGFFGVEEWQMKNLESIDFSRTFTNSATNTPAYPSPAASVPSLITPGRYVPPPGYALAELLPGRTVRMRLVTPGFVPWAPGQHFLLCAPGISPYASHPFTAASVCDMQAPCDEGRELMFLIRAKSGWTKNLHDAVTAAAARGQHLLHGDAVGKTYAAPRKGVLMRAWVDGPFGSAVRARWGDHASALIVTGGSGVSFGLSALQYMCLCMAGRDGRSLGGRPGGYGMPGFNTTRVRFVWIVREFGHIQWGASILRRCRALLPASELQIDIFVTNVQPSGPRSPTKPAGLPPSARSSLDANLTPPVPRFARQEYRSPSEQRSRSASPASPDGSDADTDTWADNVDLSYYTGDYVEDHGALGHEEHVLDLTNFEGDDDTALPGERQFNMNVKREGRLRRANTRRKSHVLLAKQDLDVRAHGEGEQRRGRTSNTFMDSRTRLAPLEEDKEVHSVTSPPLHGGDAESHSPTTTLYSPTSPLSAASTVPFLHGDHLMPAPVHQPLTAAALSASQPVAGPSKLRRPDSTYSRCSALSETHSLAALIHDSDIGKEVEGVRLELEDTELQDIGIMAEYARPGKPKLERILADEVERARGAVLVGCCGPTSLNAMIRKAIAAQVDPARIARGDMRGSITLISEDFEY